MTKSLLASNKKYLFYPHIRVCKDNKAVKKSTIITRNLAKMLSKMKERVNTKAF